MEIKSKLTRVQFTFPSNQHAAVLMFKQHLLAGFSSTKIVIMWPRAKLARNRQSGATSVLHGVWLCTSPQRRPMSPFWNYCDCRAMRPKKTIIIIIILTNHKLKRGSWILKQTCRIKPRPIASVEAGHAIGSVLGSGDGGGFLDHHQ